MFGVPSETEIQEAYKEGVKQWHPDLYENFASLRADAEEHFKQIQVAYRGLTEHNTGSVAEVKVEKVVVQPRREEAPAISFGDAPGCLTEKQFTSEIKEMVAPHMGKLGLAHGDRRYQRQTFAHRRLPAVPVAGSRGIMMRDSRNMISVLWYTDMGEIKLIDQRKQGKASGWQRFVGGLSGSVRLCASDRPQQWR